ncbi:MAG: hypothetical protein M9899_04685 [Bdellovibrionaceae bacterium]|nr:hypothetical protein [Pseudobdellovibrionaceae bacterium]
MMRLTWLLIILYPLLTHAQEAPQCTFEDVTKNCKALKDQKGTQYIYLDDGTYFRNPEYDTSWKSYIYHSNVPPASISPERQIEVKNLVEYVRQTLIDKIRRGRTNSSLSALERSQIQRLQTIEFDLNISLNDQHLCSSAYPNAGYFQETHSFMLCKSAMMQPNSALVAAIAHEMGHSIDICRMLQPLQKKYGEYGITALNDKILFRNQNPQTQPTITAAAVSVEDIKKTPEFMCLSQKGFLQEPSQKEKEDLAKQLVDTQKESGKTSLSDQELQAHNLKLMQEYPYCFNSKSAHNTINEAACDIWASHAQGDYISKHPPKNDIERIATFGVFMKNLCGPQDEQTASTSGDSSHPASIDRVNKIFLTNPNIQSMFGCTPAEPSCDPHARSPRSGTSRRESSVEGTGIR